MEYGGVRSYGQDLCEEGARLIHDAATDVGEAVSEAVQPSALELVPCHFQSNEGEEDGYGEDNQIHVG